MGILKKLVSFALFTSLIVGSFVAVTNAQNIIDWWRLRGYIPSEEIRLLAENSGLNDNGRKLFYVHDPELLDKSKFKTSCTVGEATIVLGCYISRQRIYLYDVDDDRLSGVEEVTAAHEILHAAYDRLSPSEKDTINALLDDAYSRLDNDRIRENVASYKARDPSIVSNELHSILATEVRDLPKELETHYERYFDDRLSVVALSEKYSAEFEKRELQIESYDNELSQLSGEISRRQAELSITSTALVQERKLLDSQRSNPEAYNQAVASYNQKVNSYNDGVREVKSLIDKFNNIVQARNAIAVEERELVEAIDTRETEL